MTSQDNMPETAAVETGTDIPDPTEMAPATPEAKDDIPDPTPEISERRTQPEESYADVSRKLDKIAERMQSQATPQKSNDQFIDDIEDDNEGNKDYVSKSDLDNIKKSLAEELSQNFFEAQARQQQVQYAKQQALEVENEYLDNVETSIQAAGIDFRS